MATFIKISLPWQALQLRCVNKTFCVIFEQVFSLRFKQAAKPVAEQFPQVHEYLDFETKKYSLHFVTIVEQMQLQSKLQQQLTITNAIQQYVHLCKLKREFATRVVKQVTASMENIKCPFVEDWCNAKWYHMSAGELKSGAKFVLVGQYQVVCIFWHALQASRANDPLI